MNILIVEPVTSEIVSIIIVIILCPCATNKKSSPKGELTLRTSVITKGELALEGTIFIWSTRA